MTPDAIAEEMRSWLPLIASPIRPLEPVPFWLARVARITRLPKARITRYWHRRVERPAAHEYLALKQAYEAEMRKYRVMETAYEAERQRLIEAAPALAHLFPASFTAPPSGSTAPQSKG